jgi:ribosome biogenesis protein UTP30
MSKLSKEKVIEAVNALFKYDSKTESANDKTDLLADDETDGSIVYLNISTKKFVSDHKILKPKRVQVLNPLYAKENTSICLIVKDIADESKTVYEDTFLSKDSETFGLIDKIVKVSQLKGEYKPYEARRLLFSQHDIFLAQDSVVTTLPKLLGKSFYGKSAKLPLPIRLTVDDKLSPVRAKNEISKALTSTFFYLTSGAVTSIKVGRVAKSFTPEAVADNIETVINYFVDKLSSNGWDGVRGIDVKLHQSPSLPVYVAETLFTSEDILDEKHEAEKKSNKRTRDDKKLSKFEQALSEVVDDEVMEKLQESKNKKSKKLKTKSNEETAEQVEKNESEKKSEIKTKDKPKKTESKEKSESKDKKEKPKKGENSEKD